MVGRISKLGEPPIVGRENKFLKLLGPLPTHNEGPSDFKKIVITLTISNKILQIF